METSRNDGVLASTEWIHHAWMRCRVFLISFVSWNFSETSVKPVLFTSTSTMHMTICVMPQRSPCPLITPIKSNKAKQFWNPQIKVVISQNISSYLTMGPYFRAKDISICCWLSIISCTSNLWVFFSLKHWRYYYWGNITWEIEICHYRPFLWYPKGIEIFYYLNENTSRKFVILQCFRFVFAGAPNENLVQNR